MYSNSNVIDWRSLWYISSRTLCAILSISHLKFSIEFVLNNWTFHCHVPFSFLRLQILAPITTSFMYSTGLSKEQAARSFVNALLYQQLLMEQLLTTGNDSSVLLERYGNSLSMFVFMRPDTRVVSSQTRRRRMVFI